MSATIRQMTAFMALIASALGSLPACSSATTNQTEGRTSRTGSKLSSCGDFGPEDTLYPGQEIDSCSGAVQLINQTDGNVVMYYDGTPLWASGTNNPSPGPLAFDTNGFLNLYDSSGNLLTNIFYGCNGDYLTIYDDCSLEIHYVSSPDIPQFTLTTGCGAWPPNQTIYGC
jgi:hypothetical protein